MSSNTSALIVLRRSLPISALALWAAMGAVTALAAGYWGTSKIPAHMLEYGSGFGKVLVTSAALVSVLALLALLPGKLGRLGRGDFFNFHKWPMGGTFRAAAVLLGFSLTAFAWWSISGAPAALAASLLALMLASGLSFCWACLVVMAQHFEQVEHNSHCSAASQSGA